MLGRAIGRPVSEIESSLGEPAARRTVGRDQWLIFQAPGRRLRIRCDASGGLPSVSSWSVTLESGARTLRAAAEPLGLWPACAPDEPAAESGGGLIRREIGGPRDTDSLTLTATVRAGRIRKIDLFDEEPDWL